MLRGRLGSKLEGLVDPVWDVRRWRDMIFKCLHMQIRMSLDSFDIFILDFGASRMFLPATKIHIQHGLKYWIP